MKNIIIKISQILRFFYNIMQKSVCPTNCKVQNLAQLWLCTFEGCNQPLLRCQQCFRSAHASADQQGKLRTHPHTGFDESFIYKNFLYLIRLYELILSKYTKTFGNVNKNAQLITWQIFSTSEFAKAFESQQALTQFYALKQLYYQRQGFFYHPPSKQLVLSLTMFTQKMFNNYRNTLLQPSQEQEYLAFYFNQVSDNSPQNLQAFINKEQQTFIGYCEQIKQKNEIFDINQYIRNRRKSTDLNHSYFTRMFQLFLIQKYSQKPEQQQIFTGEDYLTYAWQNLSIFCQTPQASAYLDEWVQNYTTFSQFMKQKNLQPTLLSFKMWKNHVPVSTQLKNKEKDKYFLDNFIFAYIQYLINNSLFTVSNLSTGKGWRQFIRYLKDYVDVCKLKGQEFIDISKYAPYYEFRLLSQDMINNIQKSTDVSFNREFCIEYLNQTYKEGGKISKKNYKNFFAAKNQQILKKQNQLKQFCQKLQQQLSKQQNQKFYKLIFNDYLKQTFQQNETPSKQNYHQFKKSVLQKFDEQQIKLQNDRFLLQEKQKQIDSQKKQQELKNKNQVGQTKTKITHKIDQAQQVLAEEINSQEEQPENVCPCCNGNVENCDKPQCQMIGYCVACNL